MLYIEVTFTLTPWSETAQDILTALAGDIGFESFVEEDNLLKAYIQQKFYDEEAINGIIADFPLPDITIAYTAQEQEDKNWNEEWEKNFFQPIVIGNRCVIHSTFHKDIPQMEYDILINPQMSFGTGHHETTNLIVSRLLETELEGKSVLDMGCGTSILAILAAKRGASPITAIDIDDWCVSNSADNIRLNNIDCINVRLGDADVLRTERPAFDLIIANINRNILTTDMDAYALCMNPGSRIFLSGFYVDDIPVIQQSLMANGLSFVEHHENNRWAMVVAEKKA
ncbi:MAG: 50S ribosomal protein L11 methyltransferase [Bacteroidaceae bacterium]|nr:50S ribosomal protein L11 methyltransferase [Bacteroidaceae bacterium]